MDDMFKAASETSTLIQQSPFSSDAKNSPFFAAYGASMYDYYEQNPQKGKRFAQAMSGWSQSEKYLYAGCAVRVILTARTLVDRGVSELVNTFPWASLKNGKVVDIGGGRGHVAIALAKVGTPFYTTVAPNQPCLLIAIPGAAFRRARHIPSHAPPIPRRRHSQSQRPHYISATRLL